MEHPADCEGASQEAIDAFWRSWLANEGVNSFDSIHEWVMERNANTPVEIERVALADCAPWHYDESSGRITNDTGSFFQIAGLRKFNRSLETGERRVAAEQPVLLQDEIGYLGIVCREFDGVMHFLMQAKIEPGNVNKVQVSPTIQATRSNFLQLHGGRRPAYLDYFLHSGDYEIVVDQIQSEQSSRFLGKRNRNVVVLVRDEVEVLPTHIWMTLGQIKRLMRYDNLVNMDTRTVLSCLPWSQWSAPSEDIASELASLDAPLLASLLRGDALEGLTRAYHELNDYKMFDTSETELVPLRELSEWEMRPDEVRHKKSYPFRVIFCDIAIEGREVRRWNQPLFEACGKALFGLLACERDGALELLVKVHSEMGCFDRAELAPTLQREAGALEEMDEVERLFCRLVERGEGVACDVMLSEEGGRFYCEQNRNVIVRLGRCPDELIGGRLPKGYLWLDYASLCLLLRANNALNIQLRNLLSLLDFPREWPLSPASGRSLHEDRRSVPL